MTKPEDFSSLFKAFRQQMTLDPLPFRFESAEFCHQGGRDYQEDAKGSAWREPAAGCWVLADGLGGHGSGSLAARLAVSKILQEFSFRPLCSAENAKSMILEAHNGIVEERLTHRANANMATTVVVLLTDGYRATWAHVGDSRLYHLRGGRVVHKTKDQSLINQMLEQGALTPQAADTFPDRNIILHALGESDPLEIVAHESVQLYQGDGFFICSDGVWGLLKTEEIRAAWLANHSASAWITAIENLLYTRVQANSAVGKQADNYSAIAVRVLANGAKTNISNPRFR